MYNLITTDGRAKRGEFKTVHGTIQTPVFMNVGTAAAIKGAVATTDLQQIKTQVELSNTYHLHLRPGDKIVKKLGGLHKFMNWDKPILTDSGGFQVFSLTSLRKIKEEGVYFNSHIDGHKIFMDRKRVCRFSRIWLLQLRWHLMSVRLIRQQESICRNPLTEQHAGFTDARVKWKGLIPYTIPSIKINFCSESTKDALLTI